MAKKRVNKGNDNPVDNDLTTNEENGAGNNTSTTPQDSSAAVTTETRDFIDSDSSDIAQSLTSILSVPTESVNTTEQATETREDVLGLNTGRPKRDVDDEGGFSGFDDLGSEESSALFEDNELLAEIGVEMIDMLMTYGAMAIAKDWDDEKKYSIKEARKKKLRDPLAKILESREVKTAPELVFAFMIVVSYSPIMITAVQERRRKKNSPSKKVNRPIPSAQAVVTEPKRRDDDEEEWTVGASLASQIQQPSEEEEDAMAEMMAKMQPKKKSGRPVGGTDLKPRVALSEEDRQKQINKAKALRKDGKSFSAIAKELNVSEGTATRWVRS
jgi:hypothetical protein